MASAAQAKEWRFSQCFGETSAEELTDADILSAVEFDQTGQYLATGDKGGRIVVFDVDNSTTNSSNTTPKLSRAATPVQKSTEYKFHCEFQSHEPEFDYLKSLEIEEKINQIKWCPPTNASMFLLSTNDKTIKLWKICEKQIKTVSVMNVDTKTLTSTSAPSPALQKKMFPSPLAVKIPKLSALETVVSCHPRRVFSQAHAYHINSISVNSDGETFMSADDLRINLWNLNISNQSYNIVDIKPDNMEELTEVITAADYHPTQCNIFMYSSSRGSIKLGDMRDRALCDRYTKVFEEQDTSTDKSFFSEIIASISDCRFSKDGRYIVSRDYLTLKIWDVKMENKPIKTISIHEHLRPKLCDLYETDCIFDKFKCAISGDGKYVATGSYHNYFHIYDRMGKTDVCIEATNYVPSKRKLNGSSKPKIITNPDLVDYGKKAMNLAWHPSESIIAVCALNQLYVYNR